MRGAIENGWWGRALVCGDVGAKRVVLGHWGSGKRGKWTTVDTVMLWVMVETRVDRGVWFGHSEYQLEN